ncbi:ABC transporter permease [Pseudoflavitalea rhizosphaerae]|uniref:ABC transporter permease n=1 Tax=Pseudoflavitalea rhizosphaerae TaxID=1884793 RepID=UPI000F8EDDCA|nr:ABC transporter permease [Pseudoflavitalea rhizosphaerae]
MLLKIAWKNLWQKPLNTLLSWLLLAVSVAIISVLLLFQQRFEQQFSRSISNVDMVIGAKGSPLQLVLSAVFHIDAPTGNIKYAEVEKWMQHPYVATAIPLAYGDAYKGYSIVGTTQEFVKQPGIGLIRGKFNAADFEVVAGHGIAQKLGLKPGSKFYSTHGNDEHAEAHNDHPYTITGILKPTGQITDNLLITNLESVWKIHEHGEQGDHEAENDEEHHAEHTGEHHAEHDEQHQHQNADSTSRELTAVLLKFRNPVASIQLPRTINEQTGLMAAVPAIEINRLFSLFGIGIDVLTAVGIGIMILSGLSIFVALFNSLKERKYELALMRTMGASRSRLLFLLLLEAGILCMAALVTGLTASRLVIGAMADKLESDYRLSVSPFTFHVPEELNLCLLTIFLSLAAALIPAIGAWFINISKTLSHE